MLIQDALLLRQLQQGQESALGSLIDRYSAYVGAVCRRVAGQSLTQEDIEELCADVFVVLWHHAEEIRTASLKSYLGTVARNRAINALRDAGHALPLEEDYLELRQEGPEDEVERRERAATVRAAISSLPKDGRELFLRHYYYGDTVARIARDLNMNENTVKTRLRRGREKLRGALAPYEPERGGVLHVI